MNNDRITPENLISAIDGQEANIFIGAWSQYALASMALPHYFPDKYVNDDSPLVSEEAYLINNIGCKSWDELIKKYHSEVGYTQDQLDNTEIINQY